MTKRTRILSPSEKRRLEIDKLRERAEIAYTALEEALNADGHDRDCVLRCIEQLDCNNAHYCPICGEDEGTIVEIVVHPYG